MSQQTFIKLAQDSILFAIFKAETEGVTADQITLWLREHAARQIA